MDVFMSQTLLQMYTYFYQQVVVRHDITTSLPTPDKVASVVGNVVYSVYQNLPTNIQAYYDKVLFLQAQYNILSLFLLLVVLYIVYSLIMASLRMVFRLVYNFIRFSLIVLSITYLIYLGQQYMNQGTPLTQFILDNLLTRLNGQSSTQI